MTYIYDFELKLFFEDEEIPKQILEVISPDMTSGKIQRSETNVRLKKDMLSITIKAKDLTALRASFNTLLKPIMLSKRLLEVF
ncbi:MAG: KEOPS complex subunit Pcc1 [Candidatus Diapherotrites archaeon]